MLVKFRSMNSGLGNRDGFRSADAMSQDDGRITICPLCLKGRNDEIHLLLSCSHGENEKNNPNEHGQNTGVYPIRNTYQIFMQFRPGSSEIFPWTRTESE